MRWSLKKAMQDDRLRVCSVYKPYGKRIRIDFEPRFGTSPKRFSLWVSRDYFIKKYPEKAYLLRGMI